MPKDVFACIRERRSIRKFNPEGITRAEIIRLLEAACLAPSAANLQPWFFFVVENKEVKEKLKEDARGQNSLAEAPVVIVVCVEEARVRERFGSRGVELFMLQDTAAAVQNLLLAATALGFGSCWVGAFNEEKVASLLGIDVKEKRPVAIIPLGYPVSSPKEAPARRPVADVALFIE